jgi:nitroreductase
VIVDKGVIMDVVEAIRKRKSIRDFKSDTVSRETIGDILEIACRAPSSVNAQPWEFVVLAGDVLDSIKLLNVELFKSNEPFKPEFSPDPLPRDSVYRERQVKLAVELFRLLGIERGDKEKRNRWIERGLRFYDAPAVIVILVDRSLDIKGTLFDIGALLQNICLAALKYELGTCIADAGIQYPTAMRKYTDIPESKQILMTVSIGIPNWDFPANKLASTREPAENLTTWHGFK